MSNSRGVCYLTDPAVEPLKTVTRIKLESVDVHITPNRLYKHLINDMIGVILSNDDVKYDSTTKKWSVGDVFEDDQVIWKKVSAISANKYIIRGLVPARTYDIEWKLSRSTKHVVALMYKTMPVFQSPFKDDFDEEVVHIEAFFHFSHD